MARKNLIEKLLGKSPFYPLQKHMDCVYECLQHIDLLIEGMVTEDQAKIKSAHKAIVKGEHRADKLKKDLRLHLPRSLFMPINRRDVLEVLLMQDAIANQAKDISGLIIGRKMVLPKKMHKTFIIFGERCLEAVEQATAITYELNELLEMGFKGRAVENIEKKISQLNHTEGETDKLEKKLEKILFSLEDEMRATDVMFTYRLIEWIGRIADDAQKVGSRLQLMLAR